MWYGKTAWRWKMNEPLSRLHACLHHIGSLVKVILSSLLILFVGNEAHILPRKISSFDGDGLHCADSRICSFSSLLLQILSSILYQMQQSLAPSTLQQACRNPTTYQSRTCNLIALNTINTTNVSNDMATLNRRLKGRGIQVDQSKHVP